MGKESTPHVGIFGRRNNGKSSLINFIAGQEIAIVSEVAGTTTDPVKKSIEIPLLGPVILVDTAGIDDEGELGVKRIQKTINTIEIVDLAILVITNNSFSLFEKKLLIEFEKLNTPYFIIHNKSDVEPLNKETILKISEYYNTEVLDFSTTVETSAKEIINLIKKKAPESSYKKSTLVGDLISYGDVVLLITPIDSEAPEGRLILPQVQVIRDILDNDAVAIVLKEKEIDSFLHNTKLTPALVVTDSQIFLTADASIPKDIPLTSFSIILAKYRGNFDKYLDGTPKISELKEGDRVLILESCTHHVSCDDIGRIRIPRWFAKYTGKELHYDVVSGLDKLNRDITDYSIVVQCGGCMITKKQLENRLKAAIDAGIPVTNYGMAISYVMGIYERAIAPFVKVENDYL